MAFLRPLGRAEFLVLVLVWSAACSAESTSVQEGVTVLSGSELQSDDSGSLRVVLSCAEGTDSVSLDPHIIATSEGSDVSHEVGLRRSKKWTDTHWLGQGSLGEAPYVHVNQPLDGGESGVNTIVQLGKAAAGEYKIFVLKSSKAPFPDSCKLAVVGAGSDDSTYSLGEVKVSSASFDSRCLQSRKRSCDYWQAGKLSCRSNSCELYVTNRIADIAPGKQMSPMNGMREGVDDSLEVDSLGESSKDKDKNKDSVSARDMDVLRAKESELSRLALAASKEKKEAEVQRELRMAVLKKDQARLAKLQKKAAAGKSKDDHSDVLRKLIETATNDVSEARHASARSWLRVLAAQAKVSKRTANHIKAQALVELKQVDEEMDSAKEELHEAESQAVDYSKGETDAAALLSSAEMKADGLREKENKAVSNIAIAKQRLKSALLEVATLQKEYVAADTMHEEAVQRVERMKFEHNKWVQRESAAEFQNEKDELNIRVKESTSVLVTAEANAKESDERYMEIGRKYQVSKDVAKKVETEVRASKAERKKARTLWLAARDQVSAAINGRNSATSKKAEVQNSVFAIEQKILKLGAKKEVISSRESVDLMKKKQDDEDFSIEAAKTAIEVNTEDMIALKKKVQGDAKMIPAAVRAAAESDAHAKAGNMEYAAAWVRVYKIQKKASEAEKAAKNAHDTTMLAVQAVKDRTKELTAMIEEERKKVEKVTLSKTGFSVVQEIDNNAARARIDLMRFKLEEATKAVEESKKEASEMNSEFKKYQRKLRDATDAANKIKEKTAIFADISLKQDSKLKDLVIESTSDKAKLNKMTEAEKKANRALGEAERRNSATAAAARQLAREVHQVTVRSAAKMVSMEADKADEVANVAGDRVIALDIRIQKLEAEVATHLEEQAEYRMRADNAGKLRAEAQLSLQTDEKRKAKATEVKTKAHSDLMDATNKQAQLEMESNAADGDRQKVRAMKAVANEEKTMTARQSIEEAIKDIEAIEARMGTDFSDADTAAKQEAIYRTKEHVAQDQESTAVEQLAQAKEQLEQEKITHATFGAKRDKLKLKALEMARVADDSVFEGHERESETALEEVRARVVALVAHIAAIRQKLQGSSVNIRTVDDLIQKTKIQMAEEDGNQKGIVMAEADARWAEQEDAKQMKLNIAEVRRIRSETLRQQMAVNKISKDAKELQDHLIELEDSLAKARIAEKEAGFRFAQERRALGHVNSIIKNADTIVEQLTQKENVVLKRLEKELDAKRAAQEISDDQKLIAEEDPEKEALNRANSMLKQAIEEEQHLRNVWTLSQEDLLLANNASAASVQELDKMYRGASEAYVTAAAMAVEVARFTTQDVLVANRELNQSSANNLQQITVQAEALSAPINRLEQMVRDTRDEVVEITAGLKVVQSFNKRVKASAEREIADINLAASKTTHELVVENIKHEGNATAESIVEEDNKIKETKMKEVIDKEAHELQLDEENTMTEKLAEAKEHLKDLYLRLAIRHDKLQELTTDAESSVQTNQKLANHTKSLAAAAVKEAFEAARQAERRKDEIHAKAMAAKVLWSKRTTDAKRRVKEAKSEHIKAFEAVRNATAKVHEMHGIFDATEIKDHQKIGNEKKASERNEKLNIREKKAATEKEAKTIMQGPEKAKRTTNFRLNEAKVAYKRAHERIWQLEELIAAAKIDLGLLPQKLMNAQAMQRRDQTKLKEITSGQVKVAGALVAVKQVVQKLKNKADKNLRTEIEQRSSLTTIEQTAQADKIKRAKYEQELVLAHQAMRTLQGVAIKKMTAAKLAGVQRRQAQLASQIDELVAQEHLEEAKSVGALGKADGARTADDLATAKATALSAGVSKKAAHLAVTKYAAESLSLEAKEYEVLEAKAVAEVTALESNLNHLEIKLMATRTELSETKGTSQGEVQKKFDLKESLKQLQYEFESANDAKARKQRAASRAASVRAEYDEKARWIRQNVVVSRLQLHAARRWSNMATTEAERQNLLSHESDVLGRTAGKAKVDLEGKAELLKAESAGLAARAKIEVLSVAVEEASAAREHVQSTVNRQVELIKKQAAACIAPLVKAHEKAKEADSMLSMGESLRTAQYKAKNWKLEGKEGALALQWEEKSNAALLAQGKAEAAFQDNKFKLRQLTAGLLRITNLLHLAAEQENNAKNALENARLTELATQLTSQRKAIALKQAWRDTWMKRDSLTRDREIDMIAKAHTEAVKETHTAMIAEGETRIAEMKVRDAERKLKEKRDAYDAVYMRAASARFDAEKIRQQEISELKALGPTSSRNSSTATSSTAGVRSQFSYLAVKDALAKAVSLEEQAEHEVMEAGKLKIEATAEVDKMVEMKIYSEEMARAASVRASLASSRKSLAQHALDTANERLRVMAADTKAGQIADNNIKATIFVELLSHKQALAVIRQQFSSVALVGPEASEMVAQNVLKLEKLSTEYHGFELKTLKKREDNLLANAKAAQDQGKGLASAGVRSQKLLKKEKAAEEKIQLKEFTDARKKVVASKEHVDPTMLNEIAMSINKDNVKLAIARAMSAAAKKETEKMDDEQREALSAAARFTQAAQGERSLFAHTEKKLSEAKDHAAKAEAAYAEIGARLEQSKKNVELAKKALEETTRAKDDGSREWKRLKKCSDMSAQLVRKEDLEQDVKMGTENRINYINEAKQFEESQKSGTALENAANREAEITEGAIARLRKEREMILKATDADQKKVSEELGETNSWGVHSRNVLDPTAKGMLNTRVVGAENELGETQKAVSEREQVLVSVEKQLADAQALLLEKKQAAVQHHARAMEARDEFESLHEKAEQESLRTERLQSEADSIKVPISDIQKSCNGAPDRAPKISDQWRKSTLENLVAYYSQNMDKVKLARAAGELPSQPTKIASEINAQTTRVTNVKTGKTQVTQKIISVIQNVTHVHQHHHNTDQQRVVTTTTTITATPTSESSGGSVHYAKKLQL